METLEEKAFRISDQITENIKHAVKTCVETYKHNVEAGEWHLVDCIEDLENFVTGENLKDRVLIYHVYTLLSEINEELAKLDIKTLTQLDNMFAIADINAELRDLAEFPWITYETENNLEADLIAKRNTPYENLTDDQQRQIKKALSFERNMCAFEEFAAQILDQKSFEQKLLRNKLFEICAKVQRKPDRQRHYTMLETYSRRKETAQTQGASLVVWRERANTDMRLVVHAEDITIHVVKLGCETGNMHFALLPAKLLALYNDLCEEIGLDILNKKEETLDTASKLYIKTELDFTQCVEIAEHI